MMCAHCRLRVFYLDLGLLVCRETFFESYLDANVFQCDDLFFLLGHPL